MTDLEKEFLRVLDRHQGLHNAISVPDMAIALRVSGRQAQKVKRNVVDAGHLVGSSCGESNGWYLPISPDEVTRTVAQYKRRIRSLALLIQKTEGAAELKAFMGQLALEFERDREEEPHVV